MNSFYASAQKAAPLGFAALLAAAAVMLMGCGSTAMTGAEKPARVDTTTPTGPQDRSKADPKQPAAQDAKPKPTEHDGEDERAQQPAQVSGAFLTDLVCEPLPNNGARTYGCRVERDQVMADLTKEKAAWSLTDASGQPLPAARFQLTLLPAGSDWHAKVVLAPEFNDALQVHADVDWTDRPGKTDRLVKDLAAVSSAPLGQTSLATAPGHAFHLGNNDFMGSACKFELSAVPLHGARLSWPLRVETAGRVSLGVRNLCGVDYTSNTLTLRQGKKVLARIILEPGQPDQDLGSLALAAGDYELVIEAPIATTAGDRDDFVIGGLWFDGDAHILAGPPTMSE